MTTTSVSELARQAELSVQRTFSADFFNSVANTPGVREFLGQGDDQLDLEPIIKSPSNFCFQAEGGGFVCHQHEPGIYEVHSMFLPEARGTGVAHAMRDSMAYMFLQTDCVELVTRVPETNRAAKVLARIGGFKEKFSRKHAWPAPGGPSAVSYQGLSLLSWTLAAAAMADEGEGFHNELLRLKESQGSELVAHDDDPVHDAVVGATIKMVKLGNAVKGVQTYNRWARLAGYEPVKLLSTHPAVVDLHDAVVSFRAPDQMEFLLCR